MKNPLSLAALAGAAAIHFPESRAEIAKLGKEGKLGILVVANFIAPMVRQAIAEEETQGQLKVINELVKMHNEHIGKVRLAANLLRVWTITNSRCKTGLIKTLPAFIGMRWGVMSEIQLQNRLDLEFSIKLAKTYADMRGVFIRMVERDIRKEYGQNTFDQLKKLGMASHIEEVADFVPMDDPWIMFKTTEEEFGYDFVPGTELAELQEQGEVPLFFDKQ